MNPASLRIGIGHDTHRLIEGGPLRLGGIDIEFNYHLDGHSDADVLLHAVIDALLGAAGAGDIGEMFPNTADVNRDRDSIEMLEIAVAKIRSQGFDPINLDCIVFAEKPKLSSFKTEIAQSIADAVGIPVSRVNIKAKTGESIGDVGHLKCMMAECSALLYRARDESS